MEGFRGIRTPILQKNIHLERFIIPSYSLKTGGRYKVHLLVTLEDEPSLTVSDSTIYEIVTGEVVPCIGGPGIQNFVSKIKWGEVLNLESDCSRDEDVFYEAGEIDDISYEWYCQRSCQQIHFQSDYQYEKDLDTFNATECENYLGQVSLGCFIMNVTNSVGAYFPRITESQWTNADSPDSLQLMKDAHKKFGWGHPEFDLGVKELYSMLNNNDNKRLRVQTIYSIERDSHVYSLVATNNRNGKIGMVSMVLLLITGTPPSAQTRCISNCQISKLVPTSSRYIYKVNRFFALRFQLDIEKRVPGVKYNFGWCHSYAIPELPEHFGYSTLKRYLSNAACSSNWTIHSSSGTSSSGMSLDTEMPFQPAPDKKYPKYFLLVGKVWRNADTTNSADSYLPYTLNTAPILNNLNVMMEPPSGLSLETIFTISCSGAVDEDSPMTYSIGFSFKTSLEVTTERDCFWLMRENPSCYFRTKLPSGHSSQDSNLVICVLVTDSARMSSLHSHATVNVQPSKLDVFQALSESGDAIRDLEALSGDREQQLIMSSVFLSQLSQSNKNDSDISEGKTEKSNIRFRLLNMTAQHFKNSNSTNLSQVRLVSQFLEMVTDQSDEISQEILNKSVDMSEVLQTGIHQLANDSSINIEELEAPSLSLVSLIGNLQASQKLLKASPSNSSSTNDKDDTDEINKDNVEKTRRLTRSLADSLLQKIVVGQKEMSIQSKHFGIKLLKKEAKDFANNELKAQGGSDCSSFKMTSTYGYFEKPNVFDPTILEEPMSVNTVITTMDSNPILYSNVSRNISSRVVSMEFKEEDGKLYQMSADINPVKNNFQIWVDTADNDDRTKANYSHATAVIPDEPMVYHVAHVSQGNVLFLSVERFVNITYNYTVQMVNDTKVLQKGQMIIANPESYNGTTYGFQIFIGESSKPTESQYDLYCSLPNNDISDECEGTSQNSTQTRTTTLQSPTVTTASNYSDSNETLFKSDSTVSPPLSSCEEKRGLSDEELVRRRFSCFFDVDKIRTQNGSRTLYIGVRAVRGNSLQNKSSESGSTEKIVNQKMEQSEYVLMDYKVLIRSAGCYFLNETTQNLEQNGCQVGACSTLFSTQCLCNHLTSFMSSVFVPPIQIDLSDSGFLKLDSNPIAFSLCLSIVCFWFLVIIWAGKRDKDDLIKAGVIPLICNDPRDKYSYEITVWTGRRSGAGTTAHVSFFLYGDEGETRPRIFFDRERPVLQRGEVDSFLMTTAQSLGDISILRVFHDNYGDHPSWYFSRMCVEDLQTSTKYYFIGNKWLSLDHEEGLIDRVIPAAGNEEIRGFDHVFWSKTGKNLFDGHIWFSVVTRPARSKFTRVQRATCCLVLLMWTLAVNLMFYGQESKVESPKLFEIGPIRVSPHSIFMATVSSLIVIPINILIVVLFRNRRDRVKARVSPEDDIIEMSSNVKEVDYQNEKPSTSKTNSQDDSACDVKHSPYEKKSTKSSIQFNIDISNEETEPNTVRNHNSSVSLKSTGINSSRDKTINSSATHSKTAKERAKSCLNRIYPFPWWTFIIAYILSFISVCVCTFLMVEFGGVLGETKTAEWLASISISLLQSIIIIQPIKILAIVLVYAIVIKQPEEDEDEVSKELMLLGAQRVHHQTTINDLNDPLKLSELQKYQNLTYLPPSSETLEEIRIKRQSDKECEAVVKDCFFYIIFVIFLMTMAYTNQDYRSFLQNNFVSQRFTQDYSTMKNISDIYSYLEKVFIPSVYPEKCYNNKSCSLIEGLSTSDLQIYFIRQPQIRQVRVPPQSECSVVKEFKTYIQRCRDSYEFFDEDTNLYTAGWQLKNPNLASSILNSPWEFISALKLYGTPHWGEFATYGGGGYVAKLGETLQESLKILEYLRNHSWIDPLTRGVFFELVLFNPATNLFTASVMVVEQTNLGSLFPNWKFYTLKLDRYVGVNSVAYLAIDVICVILIFIFVVKEIVEMRKKKSLYFKSFWNLMDLLLIICCFVGIAFFSLRITVQKGIIYLMKKNPNQFINFEWFAYMDECTNALLGFIVFLFTTRLVKLLEFNRKIAMLARTIKVAAKPLGVFLIMFLLIFLAFAQWGYLAFHKTAQTFSTFTRTIETLGVMSLNKFDFNEFVKGGGTVGLTFFFIYMLFIAFILINFFVTIICEALEIIKNEPEENQRDILEYCIEKIRNVFGLKRNNDEEIIEDQEVESTDIYDKLDEKIEHLIKYIIFKLNYSSYEEEKEEL